MAKKKNNQRNPRRQTAPDLSLPQNIVAVGEQVQEDKKIYISQSVYREIHQFTRDKTENESGGVLVGNVIEAFGKTHIVIRAFVEAKYSEGTPTTLKFTHQTWEYIHKELGKKYPQYKILGWIHTHPNFGIFLSDYDKFIHENFFQEENQIAYVIDPIQNDEGFYFWISGRLERCKGFFLFDRTGVRIAAEPSGEDSRAAVSEHSEGGRTLSNIIMAGLGIAVAALLIFSLSLRNRVDVLERQQQMLVETANASLNSMMLQINALSSEVDTLEQRVAELEEELHPQQPEDQQSDGEVPAEDEAPIETEDTDG